MEFLFWLFQALTIAFGIASGVFWYQSGQIKFDEDDVDKHLKKTSSLTSKAAWCTAGTVVCAAIAGLFEFLAKTNS
jgi:hypothetical protein